MMERRFAKFFHRLVHELIPDNGQRDQLFDSLRRYQSSQKLHQLLVDLRQLLDEPDKLELFEFIRPLILLRHQMEYSYLAPAVPGVRLRTVRFHRTPNQSLGFAVRGGYEFNVGVFVSKVEPDSQAEKQGLKVGDEIVRVNGFTIAEAIHEDVLNLIKSKDEIVLKVTHIGMLPVKEHASDPVTWQYVEDMDSKRALDEVLAEKQVRRGRGIELKIFIDCTGYDSIGCGILSGPPYYPGIFVEKVRPGSLAQEVGLEVGDQIVEVNETSFQNIGHKEAVVVLKGSKQLNVILRKHAGLPLFERRQTPLRGSSVAATSNRAPSTPSPPSSQRSAPSSRPWQDNSRLDESQLIAEQLSRSSLYNKPASTSSPTTDSSFYQQSTETHTFSTQAEVHSDSDSYHGSGGDGPPIPIEESSPPYLPATSVTVTTSPSPVLSFALPDSLADHVDSTSASHDSFPTTTTTTVINPSDLCLPDDLGDPVLAVLRYPAYPPDSPPWVIPHIQANVADSEPSPELTRKDDPKGLDLDQHGPSPDFAAQQMREQSDVGALHADAVTGGGWVAGVSVVNGLVVNKTMGQLEAGVLETDACGDGRQEGALNRSDNSQSEVNARVDENSNFVKASHKEFSGDSLDRRSERPVFVAPPPPCSPPSPPFTVSKTFRKLSPTPSTKSTTSTQTPQAEEGDHRSGNGFEALIEFDSETEESNHCRAETMDTGDKMDEESGCCQEKGQDRAVTVFTSKVWVAEQSECVPTLSDAVDNSKVGVDDVGCAESMWKDTVSMEVSAEVHQAAGLGSSHAQLGEHTLPPPPPCFFEDPQSSDTHGDAATISDTITLPSADTLPPPPPALLVNTKTVPPPPVPLPPPPPPPTSLPTVLGGAAAVLAARREAHEEERSPQLLGPAQPSWSAETFGAGSQCAHDQLAVWFNPLELSGRELKAFTFPKSQTLGIEMEGGTGTPLAGKIVVAAVFNSGAAIEQGLQTGDQLMMVNNRKLTDVSVAEAEQILEEAYNGPQEMIQLVYAQSNFLNDEECVTYF